MKENYHFSKTKVVVQSRSEEEIINFLEEYGLPLEEIEISLSKEIYECFWYGDDDNHFQDEFDFIDVGPNLWVYTYSRNLAYFYNNYHKQQIERMNVSLYGEVIYTKSKISEYETLKRLFVANINQDKNFIISYLEYRKDPYAFTDEFIESILFKSLLTFIWKGLFEIEDDEELGFQDEILISYVFESLFNWFRDNEEFLKDNMNYTYKALKIKFNKKENRNESEI